MTKTLKEEIEDILIQLRWHLEMLSKWDGQEGFKMVNILSALLKHNCRAQMMILHLLSQSVSDDLPLDDSIRMDFA